MSLHSPGLWMLLCKQPGAHPGRPSNWQNQHVSFEHTCSYEVRLRKILVLRVMSPNVILILITLWNKLWKGPLATIIFRKMWGTFVKLVLYFKANPDIRLLWIVIHWTCECQFPGKTQVRRKADNRVTAKALRSQIPSQSKLTKSMTF